MARHPTKGRGAATSKAARKIGPAVRSVAPGRARGAAAKSAAKALPKPRRGR